VTVDIPLQNNLVDLPLTRWDANNFMFDVQKDGSILHGTNDVFGGLYAAKTWGGMQLDLIAGGTPTRFTGADFGNVEDRSREVAVHQDNVASLNVTRKVFVPATGYFARYLENPDQSDGGAGHRRRAGVEPHPPQQRQRSGSGCPSRRRAATICSTSPIRRRANRWVAIDDQGGEPFVSYGLPATAFVFDGLSGARAASSAVFAPSDPQVPLGPRELAYQWSAVTVPPGGSITLMHFAVQETTRPAAQAAAERLLQLPPEALAGLSTEELAQVENFAAPSTV